MSSYQENNHRRENSNVISAYLYKRWFTVGLCPPSADGAGEQICSWLSVDTFSNSGVRFSRTSPVDFNENNMTKKKPVRSLLKFIL